MLTPPQSRVSVEPASSLKERTACTHSRAVDEVRSRDGSKSGQLRCLECQATFPDPLAAAEDPS
ncbi:MAG: hypothetical protein NDI90_19785 [Nitrospira sp. BO4]|jgi:hypothetical protein|nr:hypothetical protein [Nitrospira sp. BO4]MDK2745145.1 hypothetical protein [Nitrospira sp. BO4]